MPKILIVAGLALIVLAGCNTVRGAGEDVSLAGQAVQQEATETQQGM